MKKKLTALITVFVLVLTVISCTKKEEPIEEKKERVKNAFTDYVDTGRKTLEQSKELSKEADKKSKEMEKMLDDM